ncbi:MAG: divergent polysaccharide deacetylase family protein [candidate division WOR-3 bacterium]|nr:divergent polysaccharide deacetylase family protein [Candidatus Omnitrophota bacterium]
MAKKENSFFVPLLLFLILCILITGLKIIKEIRKESNVFARLYIPETKIKPQLPEKIEKLPEKKRGEVAIIIDDVGWNLSIIKEIEEINKPLTLSILPKAPYSEKIVKELKEKNYELFLHLPLEPEPPSQCYDKGLIKVDMDEETIKNLFEDNVRNFLPYIKGVNNHMGSLFTTEEEKMQILLEIIKEKNLCFVDSLTNPKSCGYKIAKEMGIKTGKRDIFLDTSTKPDDINKKIDELIKIAKEKGTAIAIGHAKETTINVLKERIADFEKNGIEIVPVTRLLH